jgi:hypothetical protein
LGRQGQGGGPPFDLLGLIGCQAQCLSHRLRQFRCAVFKLTPPGYHLAAQHGVIAGQQGFRQLTIQQILALSAAERIKIDACKSGDIFTQLPGHLLDGRAGHAHAAFQ